MAELVVNENVDMIKIDINKMSEDDKKEVMAIRDNIKFDHESISLYGKNATKHLTDFSTQILDTVKVKDTPEVENMLTDLVTQLNGFNTETLMKKRKNIFTRLFGEDNIEKFMMQYKSVSDVVNKVKQKLEEAEYQLEKDIKTSETYLIKNKEYIGELDKYILAGDMKLQEETAKLEEDRKTLDINDMLAVQEFNMRESGLKVLERKIHNLRIQRTIAIQNIPQLMLLKEGDTILVSKIDDSITQAIPLWESQIVITINAMRQQAGVEVSKSVTNTTNNLLRQNAALLKESATGVAQENERDIVDIETLKNTNNALIETIKSIKEIQKTGADNRAKSIQELAQIQQQLNQALIEAKS